MSWPPSGSTRVAAVIGDPITHSLSPVLHNAAFRDLGLDWVYVALTVSRGQAAAALAAMRTFNLGGYSVTMPHKTEIADRCDVLTEDARALRSVNCVALDGQQLLGSSTDGAGFLASLRDADVDFARRSALLLGAGGAARAVALALARSGTRVSVAARRDETARTVAELHANIETIEWEARSEAVRSNEIVINCTPVGMLGDSALPIDAEVLGSSHVVVDLVYTPRITPLLAAAKDRGAQAIDGLGMLIHQAALAFECWTGEVPSGAVMRAAALNALATRSTPQ